MCVCMYVYDAGRKDISSEVDRFAKAVMNNEQPSIAMSVAIRDDFTWVVQVQERTFDAVTLPTSCRVWPTVVCSLTIFTICWIF